MRHRPASTAVSIMLFALPLWPGCSGSHPLPPPDAAAHDAERGDARDVFPIDASAAPDTGGPAALDAQASDAGSDGGTDAAPSMCTTAFHTCVVPVAYASIQAAIDDPCC